MTMTMRTEEMNQEGAPRSALILLLALATATSPACDEDRRWSARDEDVATSVARALSIACPLGDDPGDEDARDACAEELTELVALRDAMVEPFIWGGQSRGYAVDEGTNKFNPRVWRRLYLSTFMFGSDYRVEHVDDGSQKTILHVPVQFRHALPTGAYPYPFWHAPKKWDSYSYTTTIHFVVQDGRLVAALRSSKHEVARPKTSHAWDGSWRWTQDGRDMPYVSLYGYLFSEGNPHVAKLDDAYRVLEAKMRQHGCPTCHAPDNRGGSRQLEFFVYPSQALAGRHDIITQLADDQMPPENDLGITAGITDDAERERLIRLAQDFEVAGDAALAWEGELVDRGPSASPKQHAHL